MNKKNSYTNEDLIKETSNMFGKILITHQTGPQGKKVKRLYNGIVKNNSTIFS